MTDMDVTTEPVQEPYGYTLQLNMYDCDEAMITDPKALEEFVTDLVKHIGMVKYGEFEAPHFGHGSPKTAGLSFKQWIQTSSIIGHVSEARRAVYMDVFSCMPFDAAEVTDFCTQRLSAGWATAEMKVRD